MSKVWDLRFTVEWDEDGEGPYYCACAYDKESEGDSEDGKLICGWSAYSLTTLFDLIHNSAKAKKV